MIYLTLRILIVCQFIILDNDMTSPLFFFFHIPQICAMGFVLKKGSYLRDGFNVMDFIVVMLGFVNYIPGVGNFTGELDGRKGGRGGSDVC
jgi:hypothetical protein